MMSKSVNVELAAEMAHEVNRVYCKALGDFSQPHWEEAPQWQKDSAISGVKYRLDNPDVTPAQMHEEWCRVKVADGWKYGVTKNPELKEHPCLVAYDALPKAQQVKDHLFSGVVKVCLDS